MGFFEALYKWLVLLFVSVPCALFMSIFDYMTKRQKSVQGKVVVITGGASGIGKEVAQMLANAGAKIALLDVNEKMNQEAANEINENAGFAIPFTVDVSKEEDMKRAASQIRQHPELGDPDIVICNAGILNFKSFLQLSAADIRRTFDINILGYFWTIRAFLPRMLERNQGHIVTVSSVSAYFGYVNLSDYSASKCAIRGMMESLEWELYESGKRNIKLTTVYPYFTRSPMLSKTSISSWLFRILTVEETAASIVDAILYEKVEAYTTWHIAAACTIVKAISPYRVKLALHEMWGLRV